MFEISNLRKNRIYRDHVTVERASALRQLSRQSGGCETEKSFFIAESLSVFRAESWASETFNLSELFSQISRQSVTPPAVQTHDGFRFGDVRDCRESLSPDCRPGALPPLGPMSAAATTSLHSLPAATPQPPTCPSTVTAVSVSVSSFLGHRHLQLVSPHPVSDAPRSSESVCTAQGEVMMGPLTGQRSGLTREPLA